MALGYGRPEAMFIGTALVATSVGITARVLADRGFLTTTEARIILAAAVIDDVLGMLVLSLVVGSSRDGVDLGHIGILVAQVILFVGFEMWIAPKLVKRHAHWLDRLKIPNAGFVVALIVMLAMAALSETIGLAGIVGAFFAGMMFAETEDRWELVEAVEAALRVARSVLLRRDRHAGRNSSLFGSSASPAARTGARRHRDRDQGRRLRAGCRRAWAGGAWSPSVSAWCHAGRSGSSWPRPALRWA